jgi:hypothetical protein
VHRQRPRQAQRNLDARAAALAGRHRAEDVGTQHLGAACPNGRSGAFLSVGRGILCQLRVGRALCSPFTNLTVGSAPPCLRTHAARRRRSLACHRASSSSTWPLQPPPLPAKLSYVRASRSSVRWICWQALAPAQPTPPACCLHVSVTRHGGSPVESGSINRGFRRARSPTDNDSARSVHKHAARVVTGEVEVGDLRAVQPADQR